MRKGNAKLTHSDEARGEIDQVIREATGFIVPPPAGVELPTAEHEQLWAHYTEYKPSDFWTARELITLGYIVSLDVGINAILDTALSPFGITDDTENGRKVSADLLAVKSMMDLRISNLKLLGMQTYTDRGMQAKYRNATAPIAQSSKMLELSLDDDDDLLARRN